MCGTYQIKKLKIYNYFLGETQKLGMHVEEFVADIFSLNFLEDSMICLDVKCAKVSWNFTMTSASKNILFYAIYFKEL